MNLTQNVPIRVSSSGIWNSSFSLIGLLNEGDRNSVGDYGHFPLERAGLWQERGIKASFQIISQTQPPVRHLGR